MGYGMGKLEIIDHDGQGGLTFEERPFLAMTDHAFVELGNVKGGEGRALRSRDRRCRSAEPHSLEHQRTESESESTQRRKGAKAQRKETESEARNDAKTKIPDLIPALCVFAPLRLCVKFRSLPRRLSSAPVSPRASQPPTAASASVTRP